MKVSNVEMIIFLQKKMYRYIEQFGVTDPRTVRVSQRLDKHIWKEQIKMNRRSEVYGN